ncbi:MAG: tetratricopeptide repeat protein [Chloroherpetonaceae bacterium]|nr:tetratricopeptide repeat protein [Chloroherpetonaceae bacterium]
MPLHVGSEIPAGTSQTPEKREILWHGSFFVYHSLALVNRELTLALLEHPDFAGRYALRIAHYEPPVASIQQAPRFRPLVQCAEVPPSDACLTIRHRWPPDFSAPPAGKLALIQPWEFGSLPRAWVQEIARTVHEVWVPSSFVARPTCSGGVPGDRVFVVPNGVNTDRFHPGVAPFDFQKHPATRHLRPETFKFLFVGGTIPRKGIDVLLDAYDRAFTARDDVVLIIKDFGTHSFYANQGMGALIQALQVKPGAAQIVYLTDDLTEDEMAGLYAACDCLAHPYRGEGYGLPIAEAMACGKPTLVTDFGAALDFANPDNSYLIPATVQRLPERRIGDLETVDYPFLAEPERDALIDILRYVVSHPEEAREKGAQAARDIVERHTWKHVAEIALQRIHALTEADSPAWAVSLQALPMGLEGWSLATSSADIGHTTHTEAYEARKQTALTLARQAQWAQAVRALEDCLNERPEDWDVVNALAVARFRTGDADRALEMLQQGVQHAPHPRDFHHNLAFILLEKERPVEALQEALRALHYTPDNPLLQQTAMRAREQVLRQARRVLRRYPASKRMQAKRDPEYRALMEQYRQSGEILAQSPPATPLPSAASASKEEPSRPRISLCMIVKNEERFLRNCLESVRGVVDEIVIVDTGSTDGTLDIAREYGAKIVHHPWNDDFSEARNVSLAHATGDWALWLDADEELAPETRHLLRPTVENASDEIGGFMIMFRNWLSSPQRDPEGEMAVHHACRLFRLVPGVRFEGRIHEQNVRSLMELGYAYAKTPDLIIDHFGYAHEIMTLRNKHERFLRMLHREVEECPIEAFRTFHLFNLGNAYFTFGDMENAARYLGMAAEKPDLNEEYTVTLFVELATALHRLGRSAEGLAVCERADALGIRQAGIDFARGYCLLHLMRYEEAEMAFRSAIAQGQEDRSIFAQTGDRGAYTYKARYGLGLALVGQDRYEEAVSVLQQALEEQPRLVDARYLLAVALTRQDRTAEACRELERVLEQSPDYIEAERDLALTYFAAKDYARALPYARKQAEREFNDYEVLARYATCCEHLGLLEEALTVYERLRMLSPDSAEVCVNLGRILAATGDTSRAIDCFSDAIQLNPDYGNAYFNAGDLLYRLGYYGKAAETYLAGLERDPSNADGFFVLGNCYFHTGDYAAAELCYRQALEQNPDHEGAQHNLDLLLQMPHAA